MALAMLCPGNGVLLHIVQRFHPHSPLSRIQTRRPVSNSQRTLATSRAICEVRLNYEIMHALLFPLSKLAVMSLKMFLCSTISPLNCNKAAPIYQARNELG